ncbi:hypothetical protein LA080_010125 [Diaporthe eres]|nr:hypothetical protein LA080_010125 [Diaporthe eres]
MANENSKQGFGMSKQQSHTPEGTAKVIEFLDLPAEIRNMIYWNVLVKKYNGYCFRQPSLTLVNKQIRSESLPILYGNALFSICLRRYSLNFKQLLWRWPLPPAMSNLAHITRLDIRFSLGIRGHWRGSAVQIHMRKTEADGSHLMNKELMGRPGLRWKRGAGIRAFYNYLILDPLTSGQHQLTSEENLSVNSGRDRVVRGLLYFAEKCPAAAEWVWMAAKVHNRNI